MISLLSFVVRRGSLLKRRLWYRERNVILMIARLRKRQFYH